MYVNKVVLFLAGCLVGAMACYHIIIHHGIDYRISFYGYTLKNNKPHPVIKLRKKLKGAKTFHVNDEGIELSTILIGEMGDGMEFTDLDAYEMFKNRYCK